MSNINLAKNMQALTVGRKLDNYTGVIIHAGQSGDGSSIDYSAGSASGYVLEIDNPIGTQAMADMVLAGLKLRGVRYQPFEADSAILDPAAELGDNVTVNGLASVLFSKITRHSHLMAADAAAPHDEEVDHEFTYVPRTVREFRRESAYARSRITLNEEQISLEVVRATTAEGTLASRITLTEDAITSEVARATAAEGTLSSRITQTADAITSEVARATAAEGTLSTRIEQRLDRITLSVSSSGGSSTFEIKDGSTTLDTKSLDLSVKAVNISGTLTIGQLPSDVATDADIPTKVSELTNDSGFQNAAQVTTITNTTIATTNVLAQNLKVNSANINGLLSASQIAVGSGSNLLPNYDSFEQITNTTLYYAKSSALTADILSTNYAREGAKVMRLASGTDVSNAYVFIGHSTNNYGQVRCSAGRYVFSFYARNTTGQSVLQCRVYGRKNVGSDWSDSTTFTILGSSELSITGDYVRCEIPFEVTSTYPIICARFAMRTASRTIYVDCLQLERVDSAAQGAGAWHPAGSTIINGGNISAGTITANAIAAGAITADKISVTDLSALGATIGGWTINQNSLSKMNAAENMKFVINAPTSPASNDYCLYTQVYSDGAWSTQFALRYDGSIYAKGTLYAWSGSNIGGVSVNSSGDLEGISTTNLNSYVNGGVGGGVSFNEAKSGTVSVSNFYISTLVCSVINDNNGGSHRLQWKHIQINGTYYYLLGAQY